MSGRVLETKVFGYRLVLLGLAVKTAFLSVITLGLYSPWARTRVRRWLWSSVAPGDTPLEYTGQPLEKLMGFFMAATFVAFYIGLFVTTAIFFSLQMTGSLDTGVVVAVLLLVPLYFYAQYRGRRYLLNHTSWRGLSFWMQPGAWGYTWHALLWTLLTLLSLGLLGPLRRFILHRYMINRTFFGNKRFVQVANPLLLYQVASVYFIGVALSVGVIAYAMITETPSRYGLLFLTAPIVFVGWFYYRVAGFRLLYSSVVFDGEAQCDIYPRTGKVLRIYIFGTLLKNLLLAAVAFVVLALIALVNLLMVNTIELETLEKMPPSLLIFGTYFAVILFYMFNSQLKLAFITFPLISHTLSTLVVHDAQHLDTTGKGQDTHMHDADGLATIFDFGGGSI